MTCHNTPVCYGVMVWNMTYWQYPTGDSVILSWTCLIPATTAELHCPDWVRADVIWPESTTKEMGLPFLVPNHAGLIIVSTVLHCWTNIWQVTTALSQHWATFTNRLSSFLIFAVGVALGRGGCTRRLPQPPMSASKPTEHVSRTLDPYWDNVRDVGPVWNQRSANIFKDCWSNASDLWSTSKIQKRPCRRAIRSACSDQFWQTICTVTGGRTPRVQPEKKRRIPGSNYAPATCKCDFLGLDPEGKECTLEREC